MILSDIQLKIPGKVYKVRVRCVSTRRLTTIEWLILSCTKRFEQLPSMSGKTLKYAFEEVFQFQNSELLIKPCLQSLINLKVIRIKKGDTFDYNTLCFSDIDLTDLGIIMLKDGLLPGESREIPLDIYYNPLTGRISSYNNSLTAAKEVIEFGADIEYNSEFPEETIKADLQAGSIGSGRFTASKFRIEEIDRMTAMDWESIIPMSVDVNDKGVLTTIPSIIAESMKHKVQDLLITKEINKVITGSLPPAESIDIQNIIGSGKALKTSFLDVCKNGKILFIESRFYNIFKRNTASFKDKTIILFKDKDGFSIENDKQVVVHISEGFFIDGCVAFNDKGEHVSFCRKEYKYENRSITAPLAVEDKRLITDGSAPIKWLEKVALDNLKDNVIFAALFTFPMLTKSQPQMKAILYKQWDAIELSAFIDNVSQIQNTCTRLGTEMFDVSDYINNVLNRIDFSDSEAALGKVRDIMSIDVIAHNPLLCKSITTKIIKNVSSPTNYSELLGILQILGIHTHDDALQYDDYVDSLYSNAVVKDIIVAIANKTYKKLPEFFELDAFFNDYAECINQIENHVSGLKIFEKNDDETILNSVKACPDFAALQSFVAELKAKNISLMTKGINVYDVLRNNESTKEKAAMFTYNSNLLEEMLSIELNEVYLEQKVNSNDSVQPEHNQEQKIYIVDTCAMMHHPEIFLYFDDSEYVRVPTKVIDELGKIKDKRNKKYSTELAETARTLAREIERAYVRIFNKTNKVRFLIENASLDLLPPELDPTVPDNQILSVALKYKDWDVFIISDDGVFRLTSLAQKIHPITSEEFISSHQNSYKSLTDRIKAYNEIGGKQYQEIEESVQQKATKDAQFQSDSTDQPDLGGEKGSIDDALALKNAKSLHISPGTLSFLNGRKIKTVGDLRRLTLDGAKKMSVKGQQFIYKNEIIRVLERLSTESGTKTTESSSIRREVSEEKNKGEEEESDQNGVNLTSLLKPLCFFIENNQLSKAQVTYEDIVSHYENISKETIFQHLLSSLNVKTYSSCIKFILRNVHLTEVMPVFSTLDVSVKTDISKELDYSFIKQQLLIPGEAKRKTLTFLKVMGLFSELPTIFQPMSWLDIILTLNHKEVFEYYWNTVFAPLSYQVKYVFVCDKQSMRIGKFYVSLIVNMILMHEEHYNDLVDLLIKYYSNTNVEGNTYLNYAQIVSLSKIIGDDNIFYNMVEVCTNTLYKAKVQKRYAQDELSPKAFEMLDLLIHTNIPLSRMIFIYFNTKLRETVHINRLINELLIVGKQHKAIVSCIRDYWIAGEIKYVQEDGLVRVAAQSISSSRLMVYKTNYVHINKAGGGWVDPTSGMKVYFKIKDYLEDGGLFYIDYLCEELTD